MELFTVQKGHCHQRRGPGLSPGLRHSALCGSLFLFFCIFHLAKAPPGFIIELVPRCARARCLEAEKEKETMKSTTKTLTAGPLAKQILLVSLPTFILQNMFQSFFVTAEKPHLGFAFTVGAGCTNMVLDVVLVGVLRWGVEGAAVATFLSQIVGGLLPVFYFLDRNNTSRLHLSRTKFHGRVLRNACINGSSELMTNLSMSLVNILYNYQLLRFAGEDGVAAYGVIMYAAILFVAVFVGYAVGSAPIVSYHYGARNHREVHNLYFMSFRLIGVVAVGMTIGSMFLIPHVARIFVGYDAGLLTLTTHAFRLYALSFLIMGFNVYASSFFTALGDGVTSALISFLRTLLFQVAAVFALPALMGMDGIWLAVTAAELAALGVSVYMFVTKDRKFHYRHV